MSGSEVVIPHRTPLVPVTAVRSTLLQSSLATLRARGMFERWHGLVDPRHRERILSCIAPEWLPLEVGLAHYAACDALSLGDDDLRGLGMLTADRLQGTFLSALSGIARKAGFTPWAALPYFDRVHARIMQGGSVQFERLGPKDVQIEWRGVPLFRFEYFKVACCGFVVAGLNLVTARSPQASLVRCDGRQGQALVRCSWV